VLLRDSHNRSIGFVEGERILDDSGKPVAERASSDRDEYRLARIAAYAMYGDVSPRHRPSRDDVRACRDAEEHQVLLDLSPQDVAQASARAVISLGEDDSGCVADVVSAPRLVARDRGYVWTENLTDMVGLILPVADNARAPIQINPSYSKISFTSTGYALMARLPRGVVGNADFDLKAQSVRFLIEILRLQREQRVATLVTTSGNWATANSNAAVAKWDGGSTADPLTDVFKALAVSYLPANTIVLPENAAPYFHSVGNASAVTSIRDFVQSGGQLPTVLYARARSLVSGTPAYIWAPTDPANVAVIRAPRDPRRIPTSMTLRWLGDENLDVGERVDGFFVRSYFDQDYGAMGSDVIVVAHNDAEIMVQTTPGGTTTKCQVGGLITGALA
jgi:hypothetical protein